MRPRSARKVLTMRSSSEWNEITASRPPGFSMRSAAASAVGELAELVVHEDAQRLERARRRMDLARPCCARPCRRSRRARASWRSAASARACTMARATSRAKRSSPSVAMMCGEIALGGRVHQIGGARPVAAHAHVERAVVAEREAALGLIELHRRDAEIEHDAVDRRDGRDCARPCSRSEKRSSTSVSRPCAASTSSSAARDRVAVAVDADDARAAAAQDRARVAAGAERAVDIDAAVARLQVLEHLAGEHGNVTGQSASDSASAVAARHHSRALCASCAATREPSCFFSARTVPVASASCARKRPGSQI